MAVATLGEKGSIAFDGERFYECGIVPAEKVVNTVGAGDSYIAGFTKGVIDGLDIPACMKAGAELSRVIGSLSRTKSNAWKGVRNGYRHVGPAHALRRDLYAG